MRINLAFDISTSVIGWTALPVGAGIDVHPDEWGHIDLRRVKGGFWKKVDVVFDRLKALTADLIAKGFSVNAVFVEDPLKKFARGRSSADTISLLARFNAVISYLLRQLLDVEPMYIDATLARKRIGIPLLSKKMSGGLSHKEQTFAFLSKNVFLNEPWDLNRNGAIQSWCYDRVDSFVICVAGCQGLGEPA